MRNKVLSFLSESNEWIEGLPLGNSKLGVMVWENIPSQVFSLNHENLWRHNNKAEINTSKVIGQIRELILSGKSNEAHNLFISQFSNHFINCNAYQPFFDFLITPHGKYESCKRNLNLENAICEVRHISKQNELTYSAFVSQKHNVIIIKITSDNPEIFDLKITRQHDSDCKYDFEFHNNIGIFNGVFKEGIGFSAVMSLEDFDGELLINGKEATLYNAKRLIVKIALDTSYNNEKPLEACKKNIENIYNIQIEEIIEQHKSDFKEQFNTIEFSLGAKEQKTTEEMYQSIFNDEKCISNNMYEQLFNMARYMLLSSSSENSLPMNLQGIWNIDVKPEWESGITTDMNIQMDYWLALPAGLPQTQFALFNWIEKMYPVMKKQSKDIFSANGVYIPQYTDVFMVPTVFDWAGSFQVLWSGAAAWISQHFFEHYKYTNDEEFLFKKALPFMKECALFYKDFVVKNENGQYIVCPSASPENMTEKGDWLVNTSTMDIALIKELTKNLMYVNKKFNLNDADFQYWKDLYDNVVEFPVARDENDNILYLEEWVEHSKQGDLGHRHISHIYGLFPGKLFFEKGNEYLKEAAIKALHRRRENGFGSCATWSHAWYACCFARIGDENQALKSINDLMETGMISNFLTTHNDWREGDKSCKMIDHKLFQIEALLGVAASMCEMLLQSYDDYIYILPSLPEKWASKGYIKGIRSYNNLKFDLYWENAIIKEVYIYTVTSGQVNLKVNVGVDKVFVDEIETPIKDNKIILKYDKEQKIKLLFN